MKRYLLIIGALCMLSLRMVAGDGTSMRLSRSSQLVQQLNNLHDILYPAIKDNNLAMVKDIISSYSTEFLKKIPGHLLLRAAFQGNIDMVRLLMPFSDVNDIGIVHGFPHVTTPLVAALERGYRDVADILLAHGADVAIQMADDNMRALWAAAKCGALDVVKKILLHIKKDSQSKVIVDAAQEGGRTPCMIACQEGHADIVKLLLSYGANPNARSTYDGTALHCVAYGGKAEIMQLLLAEPNVDINESISTGWNQGSTALERAFAFCMADKKYDGYAGNPSALQVLFSYGAKIMRDFYAQRKPPFGMLGKISLRYGYGEKCLYVDESCASLVAIPHQIAVPLYKLSDPINPDANINPHIQSILEGHVTFAEQPTAEQRSGIRNLVTSDNLNQALVYAVGSGRVDTVKSLLKYDADPEYVTVDVPGTVIRETPISINRTILRRNDSSQEILDNQKKIERLLAHALVLKFVLATESNGESSTFSDSVQWLQLPIEIRQFIFFMYCAQEYSPEFGQIAAERYDALIRACERTRDNRRLLNQIIQSQFVPVQKALTELGKRKR